MCQRQVKALTVLEDLTAQGPWTKNKINLHKAKEMKVVPLAVYTSSEYLVGLMVALMGDSNLTALGRVT